MYSTSQTIHIFASWTTILLNSLLNDNLTSKIIVSPAPVKALRKHFLTTTAEWFSFNVLCYTGLPMMHCSEMSLVNPAVLCNNLCPVSFPLSQLEQILNRFSLKSPGLCVPCVRIDFPFAFRLKETSHL